MSISCDVVPGFNRKIGQFWRLNRVQREKVPFRYYSIIGLRIEYDGKGLARLCSTNSVEPIVQENIASSVSVENKAICRSSKQKHLRLR